jgi:DNA replication protein DnaC
MKDLLYKTKADNRIYMLKKLYPKKTQDYYTYKWIRANIPKEFWHVTLDNFDGDSKAMRIVEKYCNKLGEAKENGIGFLFMGPNGVGKTSLCTIILKEAIFRGYSAFFITLPEIFRQIYLGFKHTEVLIELKKIMNDTDFLVISELGKDYHRKDSTMFMRSEFDSIFRERRGDLKPLMLDTNLDEMELKDTYGDSIMSLFRSRLKMVTLSGKDYRAVKQEKEVNEFFKGKHQ